MACDQILCLHLGKRKRLAQTVMPTQNYFGAAVQ